MCNCELCSRKIIREKTNPTGQYFDLNQCEYRSLLEGSITEGVLVYCKGCAKIVRKHLEKQIKCNPECLLVKGRPIDDDLDDIDKVV
jgi:hypothetical protein